MPPVAPEPILDVVRGLSTVSLPLVFSWHGRLHGTRQGRLRSKPQAR